MKKKKEVKKPVVKKPVAKKKEVKKKEVKKAVVKKAIVKKKEVKKPVAKKPSMEISNINVRIPLEMKIKFNELSLDSGRNMSGMAYYLIKKFIEKHELA